MSLEDAVMEAITSGTREATRGSVDSIPYLSGWVVDEDTWNIVIVEVEDRTFLTTLGLRPGLSLRVLDRVLSEQ